MLVSSSSGLTGTVACLALVAVGVVASVPAKAQNTTPLVNDTGWIVHRDAPVWGWVQHNGWWRPGQRANITRRSVGDPQGDVRPNRTEDLDALTDSMLRFGYPGFEHNYGLWYDRRRDQHDAQPRTTPDVQPPFLEQPWGRVTDGPAAADGLPRYDLTTFNDWYFSRLRRFAELCDAKGTVLIHKYYMQHALLEIQPHYVDFAWRPANCVQDTGMPDRMPAANAFYDISNPVRRDLHRRYIRKCLDVLGDCRNVVHLTGQEFTGPLPFVEFWMDTIAEWERDTGRQVTVGLGAPRDVQEAVLADRARRDQVDVLDLRCWWVDRDGNMFAPRGGDQVPGRGIESGTRQAEESSDQDLYRKVREYRERYPDKAVIDAFRADRVQSWAFLMAGGSLLVRGQIAYPDNADPLEYIQPADTEIILPTYRFVRERLGRDLASMRPADLARTDGSTVWCLADGERSVLAYMPSGGEIRLDLPPGEDWQGIWFDPRTGTESPAGPVAEAGPHHYRAPDDRDWALWLRLRP
jgi:hypothetical protein